MKHWSFLLLALCWPGPAFAHSSVPGIHGIYWGMLHPFTSGPQILALFGLALLIQQHIADAEDVFHSFWAACLVGAGAAAVGLSGFDPEMLLTLMVIIAGALAASAIRLPLVVLLALSICCGLLIGYLSWPDPGVTGDMMLTTLGEIIGAVLVIIVLAGGIEMLIQATKWPWLPIAVRIAGSWAAAISLLLGALLFRKLS